MVELRQSHTGDFMKVKVNEILNMYGIKIKQVLSATTDSGKNMLKTVEKLNEFEIEENLQAEQSDIHGKY